jgi:hypothetical protein
MLENGSPAGRLDSQTFGRVVEIFDAFKKAKKEYLQSLLRSSVADFLAHGR